MSDSGKHPSKTKWVSRMTRSISTSSMPRPRTGNSSHLSSSPRPSPPNSGSDVADGADLPPLSPSLNSTPKKSWERHYKSFLRGRRFFPDKLAPPKLEKTDDALPSRKLFGKLHHSPKSPNALKEPPTMNGDVASRVQLPDLSSKSSPRSKSVGFLQPSKSSSGTESAVRGGSLFGSVFKRDPSNSSLYGTDD